MRLLTKTTLYFLTVMITLLVVAGFYLFNRFSNELNNRSDKELIADEMEWVRYLAAEIDNGTTFILRTREILIYPSDAPVNTYPVITDTSDYPSQSNSKS